MQFYNGFLGYSSSGRVVLDVSLGLYLKHFLGVMTTQPQWTIRGDAIAIKRLREWDKFQTIPRDNYVLAKAVIGKIARLNQPPQ